MLLNWGLMFGTPRLKKGSGYKPETMKYLRADLLFFMSAIASAMIGLFIDSSLDTALDINMHDTYLVVAHEHIYTGFALVFGVMSLIHFIILKSGKKAMENLSLTHYVLTLVPIVIILVLLEQWFWSGTYNYAGGLGNRLNTYISILAWILLLGQLILFGELGWSVALAIKQVFRK